MPHLLFYGPPGTGKTSTILAVAKKLYGSSVGAMRNNCLEVRCCSCAAHLSLVLTGDLCAQLNASDDRGIDVVREQIKSFASTKLIYRCVVFASGSAYTTPLTRHRSSGFKLIILDEADMMTQAAQSALRRGTSALAQSSLAVAHHGRPQ